MDEIPSTEFRKTFAKLRKPVNVTVNGHVIGQYIPAHSATYVSAIVKRDGQEVHEVHGLEPPPDASTRPPREGDPIFRFGSPRPAPKPGS